MTFTTLVTHNDAAFTLSRVDGPGGTVGLDIVWSDNDGKTTATITYEYDGGTNTYQRPGASTGEVALEDGNFRLTVNKDQIQDPTLGQHMDADRVDDFFRFFGDLGTSTSPANRAVDGTDLYAFRRALLADQAGNTTDPYYVYKPYCDYDGSNSLDLSVDYLNFRTNWSHRLLPPSA